MIRKPLWYQVSTTQAVGTWEEIFHMLEETEYKRWERVKILSGKKFCPFRAKFVKKLSIFR